MVTSDLVYSPAQVTEHRCVEVKDQNISEETKNKFEELKEKYPKVFSLNNEDIGCTQLVTMDIDTGDSPPVCQKLYTLPLKHYNWVQQEIETLECAGVIRKSISPWASPITVVPKKSTPGEPPCRRMCIDFRKLNDLQPEVHCADSQTGGNICCTFQSCLVKFHQILPKSHQVSQHYRCILLQLGNFIEILIKDNNLLWYKSIHIIYKSFQDIFGVQNRKITHYL